MIEPRIELHEGKFPVACELTFEQFAAMMDRRIESWRCPQFANCGRMLTAEL